MGPIIIRTNRVISPKVFDHDRIRIALRISEVLCAGECVDEPDIITGVSFVKPGYASAGARPWGINPFTVHRLLEVREVLQVVVTTGNYGPVMDITEIPFLNVVTDVDYFVTGCGRGPTTVARKGQYPGAETDAKNPYYADDHGKNRNRHCKFRQFHRSPPPAVWLVLFLCIMGVHQNLDPDGGTLFTGTVRAIEFHIATTGHHLNKTIGWIAQQ